MQRRLFLVLAGASFGGVQAAPPQRNLSVEMRVSDEQADAQRDAQGSVTIGSRGGRANVGGSVVVQSGSSRQASDSMQPCVWCNSAFLVAGLGVVFR